MSKRYKHGNFYQETVRQLREKGVPEKREVTVHASGSTDTFTHEVVLRTFPIMVGIPMDEVLFSTFLLMFQRNVHMMPWDGFTATQSTYLPDARNQVHQAFLKETKYSHLFMLDSDVLCPANVIERLLAHQKPIVAGYYSTKAVIGKSTPVVYDYLKDNEDGVSTWTHKTQPGNGLEKVDAVGMGCVLMSKEVAHALGEKPYDMNNGGEDLVICRKLMQLGIPLYVDWTIDCAHLGLKWF